MKNLKPLILIASSFLIFSCAGFRPGVSSDDAMGVIEKINSGQTELLIDSSSLPFVFDSEILESDTLIRNLWTGLVKAGYVVDNPVIIQQRPVLGSDSSFFSDSWEIKTFFKNLMTEDDVFIEAQGVSQRIYMVLRPGEKGHILIKAWKGESQ